MPSVDGILETALYCRDVKTTAAWYREVFGFRELLEEDRLIALDAGRRSVLLLFQERGTTEPVNTPGGIIPPHDGSGPIHLAFAISAHDFEPWKRTLAEKNVPLESVVEWPNGQRGKSLYFRDPDGHLVELATPGLWQTY